MVNNGYDRASAMQAVTSGYADIIAFGKPFISNPDLVRRLHDKLPLAAWDEESFYGGDAQGRSTWYTAVGFLSGNALLNNTPLDLTIGSQCAGCAYNGRPTVQQGAGGTVRVAFDANDSSKATLTWGNGRSVRIERYKFYLKRPEDSASVPLDVTRMLGEWQLVLDFSESNSSSFDYYGDVLVFDQYSFDGPTNRWYFEGCRADNSEDGGCSNNALAFHSAAGFFDNASGLHATVVDDSRDNYALYLADMGTNSAEGEVTVYPKGRDPDDYAAYPMRTFRTASRTFVQEGVGPAKAEAIVEHRKANGPFKSADELALVKGIGLKTVERNRDLIAVGGGHAAPAAKPAKATPGAPAAATAKPVARR